MKANFSTVASSAFSVLAAAGASAQHAQWVAFGDPDPEGLANPASENAVHPLTSPYFHEDSFVTTDIRVWFVHHDFPQSSLIGGGDAQVYAVQARVALTESIQFVAYKDGYTVIDSGLVDDEGFNDIAAGLKWAFIQDWDQDFHAAVGVGYQFAFGSPGVLQNDQELRLWASANKGFGPWHFGVTTNFLFATGNEDALGNSDRFSWHLHADYFVNEYFSPVVELNGYHVMDAGNNTPLPFSGVDVANLGGGDDVITLGLGAEIRPAEAFALRAAYEMPLTKDDDLFGYRWTLSMIFEF